MREQEVDVLIVGGGIVGAAMLQTLRPLGYRVLLVDLHAASTSQQVDADARCLTLSYASIQILTHLGVWSILSAAATRIETIHVSERGALGRALLRGAHEHPLGAVVPIEHLRQVLHQGFTEEHYLSSARLTDFNLATQTALIDTPAGPVRVRAALVIAADGTQSDMRGFCQLTATRKEYAEHALIANIGLARAHHACAYERFLSPGLIALLPQQGLQAGLVWASSPEQTARLLKLTDRDFLAHLQLVFGYRLGRFTRVGRRQVYPLRQVVMPQTVAAGVVFIGNAAQTIHPVAGQGFNLGLRDVATLAECIAQRGLGAEMLAEYQQRRQHDKRAIIDFTHGLNRLFASRLRTVRLSRQFGLVLFDNSRGLKQLVSRYASGLGGVVPDLVCGIPLSKALCAENMQGTCGE